MVTENNRLRQWKYKYYECLALEFNNPKYFEVHHLLVLTYMLQTDRYSNEYFPMAIDLLKKFLDELITPQEFLINSKTFKIDQNVNSLSSGNINNLIWKRNMLTIRTDVADEYIQDIKLWAKDVLTVIESSQKLSVVRKINWNNEKCIQWIFEVGSFQLIVGSQPVRQLTSKPHKTILNQRCLIRVT